MSQTKIQGSFLTDNTVGGDKLADNLVLSSNTTINGSFTANSSTTFANTTSFTGEATFNNTTKTNTIQSIGANTLTIGTDNQEVSLGGGQFGGRRNIAFNGAMQVQQRFANTNDATGVVSSASYALMDRWTQDLANTSFTLTANTNSGAQRYGFRKHLRIDVNAANTATHGQGDHFILNQRYEGQDLQGFRKGTADAKPMALQFWVRSNVTGTFTVEANDQDNTRFNVISYTVDSADTWEQKKVVFAADTTGVLDDDNAHSFRLMWHLVPLGSTLDATFASNTWGTTRKLPTNHVVLDSSASNYFEITGVQFEIGNVHTPFEHRSYGDELARCQRYYYKISAEAVSDRLGVGYAASTTSSDGVTFFPVTLRASPTALEQSGTATHYGVQQPTGNITCSSIPTFTNASLSIATTRFTTASGLTLGQGNFLRAQSISAYLAWSAEL